MPYGRAAACRHIEVSKKRIEKQTCNTLNSTNQYIPRTPPEEPATLATAERIGMMFSPSMPVESEVSACNKSSIEMYKMHQNVILSYLILGLTVIGRGISEGLKYGFDQFLRF